LLSLATSFLFLCYTGVGEGDLSTRGKYNEGAEWVYNKEATSGTPEEESAFERVETELVEELNAEATIYKHKSTGLEIFSLKWLDEMEDYDVDKAFGIQFRTIPTDSTGVAHILEHSVLCGSEKYKTKEPYADLSRSSLATFLNAMTFSDRTTYLFSSRNQQDYWNLMSVYMDAVFFPRAVQDPFVLKQEGWHLEPSGADGEGDLVYRGVVMNEMRGAFSSMARTLDQSTQSSLYPDNAYQYVSGGAPKDIPNLSFEDFTAFHAKFYHPSNAKIFVSGVQDMDKFLAMVDECIRTFSNSPQSAIESRVAWQPKKFKTPIKARFELNQASAVDDDAEHAVNVAWLINDEPLSILDSLSLLVLEEILVGSSSSVLQKALLDSGYGSSITYSLGKMLQTTFSIGMLGVKGQHADEIENLVISTLEDLTANGIPQIDIDASMNSVEFTQREGYDSGSDPKPINIMLDVFEKWNYDLDPIDGVRYEKALRALKVQVSQDGSKYFCKMIHDLLLSNNHRVTMEVRPVTGITYEEEESQRIKHLVEESTSEELQEIKDMAVELKRQQAAEETPDAKKTIPSISVADLQRKQTEIPIHTYKKDSVTVLEHQVASTSGICYISVLVDLSAIQYKDIIKIPLLAELMRHSGTDTYSDIELERQIGLDTGSINISPKLLPIKREGAQEDLVLEGDHFVSLLEISGKSTIEKFPKMLSLIEDMLLHTNYNNSEKSIQLLKDSISRLKSAIQAHGHIYVNRHLLAKQKTSTFIEEKMSGILALKAREEVLQQVETSDLLFNDLERMVQKILNPEKLGSGMIINLTGNEQVLNKARAHVNSFIEGLPILSTGEGLSTLDRLRRQPHPWAVSHHEISNTLPKTDEGFIIPTKVSYVAQGGILFEDDEESTGGVAVVNNYINDGYMWDQVRVLLGAYGGYSSFDSLTGTLSFLSYRDPNIDKTLKAYEALSSNILDIIHNLKENPTEIEASIVKTIGKLDGKVKNPQEMGLISLNRFLMGLTPESMQRSRDQILDTDIADFEDYAARLTYWKPSIVVLSAEEDLKKANEEGRNLILTDLF